MQVQVESNIGESGIEKPKRFRLDGRSVEIIENIDQWPGSDYCYFKVRGDDGNLYILRRDEARAKWELTMFQSPRTETLAAAHAGGRLQGNGMG